MYVLALVSTACNPDARGVAPDTGTEMFVIPK